MAKTNAAPALYLDAEEECADFCAQRHEDPEEGFFPRLLSADEASEEDEDEGGPEAGGSAQDRESGEEEDDEREALIADRQRCLKSYLSSPHLEPLPENTQEKLLWEIWRAKRTIAASMEKDAKRACKRHRRRPDPGACGVCSRRERTFELLGIAADCPEKAVEEAVAAACNSSRLYGELLLSYGFHAERAAIGLLWQTHIRFVAMKAMQLRNLKPRIARVPIDDVVSYGEDGLIEAICKFDPNFGVKLRSYAAFWIRHGIERGISVNEMAVRQPIHFIEYMNRFFAIARERGVDPYSSSGRNELAGVLADECGIKEETALANIEIGLISGGSAISLDKPDGEGGENFFARTLRDGSESDPESAAAERDRAAAFRKLVAGLGNPQHRRVVEMRMRGMTIVETGKAIGRTHQRVRQIESKAYDILARAARKLEAR